MAYSNPTAWLVDGVSLQTLAQNIETTAGMAPPPMRGDDVTIPYRAGQIFQQKQPDARIIPFQMWVRGANPDGSAPSKSKREAFYDNWRSLRNLVWRPGSQFTLTKRFPYNNGIKVVEALAQFESGMEPTMKGPNAAKMVLNLKLTDPYFYDTDWTQYYLGDGNNTVNLPGDVDTRRTQIRVNGPRTNLHMANNDLGLGLNYNLQVLPGSAATIDPYSYETNLNGAKTNGAITHFGSSSWFKLRAGNNSIGLSSDAGNGSVVLYGKGAWI